MYFEIFDFFYLPKTFFKNEERRGLWSCTTNLITIRWFIAEM